MTWISVKPAFCIISRTCMRRGARAFIVFDVASVGCDILVDVEVSGCLAGLLVWAIAADWHSNNAVPAARTESRICFSL